MHELTAITGAHGKVNHGGAVSNSPNIALTCKGWEAERRRVA